MVLTKKFNSFTNYDEGTTYQRDPKNEQEEEENLCSPYPCLTKEDWLYDVHVG